MRNDTTQHTPADVRERVKETTQALSNGDDPAALLRTPRGEGEVKEMSRTVVVDWTKLEGVLRRQMGFAIEMAARYYPKIHEPDNPDDESRQQWVRWLVAYAMNAVIECRTLRSEAQGEDRWEDVVFGPIAEAYNEAHAARRSEGGGA